MEMNVETASTAYLFRASSQRLARLADLLGCPVSAFSTRKTGVEALDDLGELLELWNALPDQAARRRILDVLRTALS